MANDGTLLFEQWWRPVAETKAVLVIVHGIAEHSGRYAYVANYMGGHGYAVATFDLRGHGHSEGDRAYVRSFDEYLSDLDQFLARVREQEPGKAIFLLGHSMGGTIIALFAITRQPDLGGLILSAAAIKLSEDISPLLVRLSPIIGRIAPKLPTIKLDSALMSRDPQVVQKYDSDPLVYRGGTLARTGAELTAAMRRIQANIEAIKLPLLIVHGTDDGLANVEGSKELYARAGSSDKTLKLYEGFYHEVLNDPEKARVFDDIVQWLEAHV